MSATPFDPSSYVIETHFAQADEAQVESSLRMIRQIGFGVNLYPLSATPADTQLTGYSARLLTIFYESKATHTTARLLERMQQACEAQSGYLVVRLDATCAAPGPDDSHLQIMAYAMHTEHLRLRLAKAVLQTLDNLLESNFADDTTVLSESLHIQYGEKQVLMPREFSGLITIGRGTSCQIQIESGLVSRMHGCFRWLGDAFSYRDMSQNGSVLIQKHEEVLVHNTEVELAGTGVIRVGDASVSFSNTPEDG